MNSPSERLSMNILESNMIMFGTIARSVKVFFHQKVTLHGASQHHSLQAKFDIYEGENVVFEGLAVNINFGWPPPVQL